MTILFLATQALKARRIFANPLVKKLPFVAKAGAPGGGSNFFAKRLARQTAVGVVVRKPGEFVLGIVLDPFNLIAVPLTGNRLITTSGAAAQIISGDITDPAKVAAAIVLATPTFATDFGIQITAKAFRGVRAGTEMLVGTAEAKIGGTHLAKTLNTSVSDLPGIFGF